MKELGLWLMRAAASWGPLSAFVVALADSAFIPLPQGVDALLIAQAMAAPGQAWFAAGLAMAGSVIGSLILYGIARKAGRMALERRISPRGLERLEERTRRYGAWALTPPMMIPLPLPTKIFVLAAGAFQMSVWHFLAAASVGRAIRYGGVTWLALTYGENAAAIIRRNAPAAGLAALAVIAALFAIHRWSARRVAEGA